LTNRAVAWNSVFAVSLLLSALFGYLAVRNVEWAATWNALENSNYWWIVPTLALLAGWTLLRAIRWQWLFRGDARPPLTAVTKATLLGLFFNNILPARAGEAARVVALRSYAGVSAAESAATIVVERLFDVFGLFALLLVLSPWLPRVSWLRAAALIALAAIGLALVLVGFAAFVDRRPMRRNRFGGIFTSLVDGLAAVRRPGQAAIALGLTLCSWLVLGVAFWFLALSFHFGLSPLAGILVAVGVGLSFLIPAAPAGVGVFEAAGLAAVGAYGIGSSRALAYVLVLHAVNLVPFLIAGAVVLTVSAPNRRVAPAVERVRTPSSIESP
jgi:uncharacterized membrane protein YbhN (UPF0104 family)